LALTCPGRERRRATSWSLQRAEAAFGRVLQPSFKPAGNDQRDNDSGGSGNSQDEANCAQRIRKRFPELVIAQAYAPAQTIPPNALKSKKSHQFMQLSPANTGSFPA
jgi:hypothetical protein